MSDKPRVLYFDIETAPLQSWIWQPGQQYVGHKQLVDGYDHPRIICLAYCWNDNKPAKSIDWDYERQSSSKIVEEFDEIVSTADHIIGKNSDRFDVKVINAVRMLHGLPGKPIWAMSSDDLEKQMRKYFRLPSQSLDYISKHMGLGGKVKMELNDWIDICEKNENGISSFKKMIKYCKKDVEDTRQLWDMLSEHFNPKFNNASFYNKKVCKHADCGSDDILPNGSYMSQNTKYLQYKCNTCQRYAGSVSVNWLNQKEGKIR